MSPRPFLAVLLTAASILAQQRPAPKKPVAPAKPAAPAPEAPKQYPLETLKVEGAKQIDPAKIIAVSGLRIGKNVTKEDFDTAREKLVATGAFESVGYEYKPSAASTGFDAVIQVSELIEYYPYRFEDFSVKDEVLEAAVEKENLIFGGKIPVTAPVLARYTQAIEKALGGTTRVIGRLGKPEGSNEVLVLFRPEQSRPNIAQVQFTGNKVVPDDLLINTFAEAAIGVPYTEAEVRRRLDSSIRPLYEARGRVHVSFPKITVARAEKVDGVVVTVTVDESEPYNLNSFTVRGVSSSEASQMVKLANLSKGDVVNFDDIKAALDRIHKRSLSSGYLKVSEKLDRQVDDKAHTVDLILTIEQGPQYRFGKLKIEGLDILTEPPIRKAWGDREGKPYQDGFPEAFLASLKEQDVFDNLARSRAETKIDDSTQVVDVTLIFKGGKPPEDPARRRQDPA